MIDTINKKEFDCLELKDKIQEKIYKEIKDLTPVQEIEYYKNKISSGYFRDLVEIYKANS